MMKNDFSRLPVKNGKTVYRSYRITRSVLGSTLDEIYATKEYKDGTYPVMSYQPENITGIYWLSDRGILEVSADDTLRAEILAAYQEELAGLTINERAVEAPVAALRFLTKAENEYLGAISSQRGYTSQGFQMEDMQIVNFVPVYPSFTKTIALLKQAGTDVTAKLSADDVTQVKILYPTEYESTAAGEDAVTGEDDPIREDGGGVTAEAELKAVSYGGQKMLTIVNDGSEENRRKIEEILSASAPEIMLGADLTPDQRATVLGFMGIELTDLDKYDVVYVNNDEEHKYLDSYISKSEIGTRSLSSVLITEDKKGAGLSVSTHNINYCTVGMYKNALATAGIADAKIIVAGPFPISGTAALVGTLKAYEEMTGKKLDDKVTDAAMDELVTTGELNKSIDGDSQDIEAMIADLKKQLADGRLKDESQIKDAIKEAAKDYDLKLSDDDIAKLTSLLMKLKDANIDWDSVINQAQDWASKLGDKINDPGFWEKIGNFFMDLWDKIKSLFS